MRRRLLRCWSIYAYLFYFIPYLLLVFQKILAETSVVEAATSDSCDSLYKDSSDVWLFGEAPEGAPFAAQLHAIFSYSPVAFVFQTGLVAGDLTVHEPIRENEALIDWRVTRAPFSSFFDLNHYVWYWSQHRLKIISSKFYQNCFEFNPLFIQSTRYLHERSNITRIPEFYPYAKDDFKNLFYYANTTSNETFQFPFLPHRQVRIVGRWKMVAFYSFWSDLSMLQYVYTSLKPSIPIDKFSKALLSLIPSEFIAIHLRVDDDAFSQIDGNSRTESDHRAIKKIVQYLKDSDCLKQYFQKKAILSELGELSEETEPGSISSSSELPTIYLSTNQKPQSKTEKRRAKKLIEELLQAGFVNVFTRKILYDRHARKKTVVGENVDGLDIAPEDMTPPGMASASVDLAIMKMLTPEQLAYVDLLVSRSGKCFIPSYIPSLASYMIQRYLRFDQNLWESYSEITPEKYGKHYFYRDWGF